MIELLIPLGLLGLLSIPVLILIYLIRPNFQTKYISSTFVWKLSLKYRKRKLPTNTLRNIILIICQILILTSMALILTQPVQNTQDYTTANDVIAVIDSSASMRTQSLTNGTTRFQRALEKAKQVTNSTAGRGGTVTVIMAGQTANYLTLEGRDGNVTSALRVEPKFASDIISQLDKMIEDPDTYCSYAKADSAGAMELCEGLLYDNPEAKIVYYTDTNYTSVPDQVTVEPIREEDNEWNMAILDSHTELFDSYYTVYVDFVCYGESAPLQIMLDVTRLTRDVSGMGYSEFTTVTHVESDIIFCEDGVAKQLAFYATTSEEESDNYINNGNYFYQELPEGQRFTDYKEIKVTVVRPDASDRNADCFEQDNAFYIYGGTKEVINILYASTIPNPFMVSVLNSIRSQYIDYWDIRLDEKNVVNQEYPLEGYDMYIFEHFAPTHKPVDGVCVLFDPPMDTPGEWAINVRTNAMVGNFECTYGEYAKDHPVLNNIDPTKIGLFTMYTQLDYERSKFDALLSINGDPLLLSSKNGVDQSVILAFSVHFAAIAASNYWYILWENILNYYFPITMQKAIYEIGEVISVNSRASALEVSEFENGIYDESGSMNPESSEPEPYEEIPISLAYDKPCSVSIKQTSYFAGVKHLSLDFYVRMPEYESNIFAQEDELARFEIKNEKINYLDLMIWVAIALVVLLLLEWWLQSRANR